ncbi:MAG: hypothetical protein HYX28_07805 [Candidatus Koribacter versatilis]|uniref:Uncharacterized protein n=1 Tax=Candidatus Korobacter versatilis TaxID=658062 RepID=A0A932EQA5_9BACT|nr:hypothetical protein [Candidatus Koribacter versatilis]
MVLLAAASARDDTYARAARTFDKWCEKPSPEKTIVSPDRRTILRVRYAEESVNKASLWLPKVELRVGGKAVPLELPALWNQYEVLWSPASDAFTIAGGASAIGGFDFRVEFLEGDSVREFDLAGAARRDIADRFVICRSKWSPDACGGYGPEGDWVNVMPLAWVDAKTLLVFAEVPSSSRFGGMMGQVMGYEVALPSGKIKKSYTARELKRCCTRYMGWKYRVPEAPE